MLTRKSGFTLIELLIVVSILGILAAVILASLADTRESSRKARAMGEMRNIHTAMEILANATGLYPHKSTHYCPPTSGSDNEVDLNDAAAGLVGTDGSFPGWDGPYMSVALDPWGTPYYLDEDYHCTAGAMGCNGRADSGEQTSALVSCGPDQDNSGAGGSCAYNDDNVVYVLCRL